ncbi:MAG: hypothetical protein Q8L13_19200 [Bradyrhizobium sp.]|uniref:hypothetical protein n=1 Tax=Bradyrhizobium sp. TaxID=376 RepID=UPI00272F3C85|nr:hypothetical protein [Bradyrhizobium sp.]MDP1868450.1 hypothetical protein [Bradyrhizobium sp.]
MDVIDEIAGKVILAAEMAAARNVPRDVIVEAFYRGALAIMIAECGPAAAIETLRDSADRLSDPGVATSIVN